MSVTKKDTGRNKSTGSKARRVFKGTDRKGKRVFSIAITRIRILAVIEKYLKRIDENKGT